MEPGKCGSSKSFVPSKKSQKDDDEFQSLVFCMFFSLGVSIFLAEG